MRKASKIILGIISGASVFLSLLSLLLQIASITHFAIVLSGGLQLEFFLLMAFPALGTLITLILASMFFCDQILMRIIRERNSKIYNGLSKLCCRSCCLKIFNIAHRSLCLVYVISSAATVGTAIMGSIHYGFLVRGPSTVSIYLCFSSMVVCCVFGLISVVDSFLIMLRNYEKKEMTTFPVSISSQLMESQSDSPYEYKN